MPQRGPVHVGSCQSVIFPLSLFGRGAGAVSPLSLVGEGPGVRGFSGRHLADQLRHPLDSFPQTDRVDGEMVLHGGQLMGPSGRLDRQARVEVHGLAGPQQIGVETHGRDAVGRAAADLSGGGAAVAQRQGHGAVGLALHDVDRGLDFPALILQPYDILASHAQFFGRGRAHHGRIVPGEPGHGVGQFLQPAVIGEPPVVDLGIRAEDDFQFAVGDRGRGDFGRLAARVKAGPVGQFTTANEPFFPPSCNACRHASSVPPNVCRTSDSELAASVPRTKASSSMADLPPCSGSISGCARLSVRQAGVVRVAPRFQEMGLRNVPAAEPRRLVTEEAETDRRRRLGQFATEVQIDGGVISRIAAQDQQRLHLAAVKIGRQFPISSMYDEYSTERPAAGTRDGSQRRRVGDRGWQGP